MAQGGQDGVDVSAIREELASIEEGLNPVRENLTTISQNLTSVNLNIPSPGPAGGQVANFAVLSWNVQPKKDKESSRDLLVSRVVDHVNPDVLLLQGYSNRETITCINDQCKPRFYTNCGDDANGVVVLYNPDVFESPRSINLNACKFFPGTDEQTKKDRKIFREKSQITAFKLKHNDTKRDIVFISFINDYDGDDQCTRRRAEGFCKTVCWTAIDMILPVVAGADLWCSDFCRGLARIPKYEYGASSNTRIENQVTNNFVSAWLNDVTVEDHISVLNPDDLNFTVLTKVFKGSVDKYKKSLHCDPLVYKLTVSDVQV